MFHGETEKSFPQLSSNTPSSHEKKEKYLSGQSAYLDWKCKSLKLDNIQSCIPFFHCTYYGGIWSTLHRLVNTPYCNSITLIALSFGTDRNAEDRLWHLIRVYTVCDSSCNIWDTSTGSKIDFFFKFLANEIR